MQEGLSHEQKKQKGTRTEVCRKKETRKKDEEGWHDSRK
jgi:hypothetical protein